ncbi:MAG: CoA transferase, partial [Gammaproteobacteria bacterium]|nr:CoA transferase [Gammaproteobacteria bacterium]
ADVLIENYRTGTAEKFGVGYEQLAAINPRLIYCSISGYGRTGIGAQWPGYDFVVQAEAGLMSITGEPDGEPMKVGVAVADLFTGMYAVQAILAALMARNNDGQGQLIDLALFDCQLAMLANVASATLTSGREPERFGNAHASVVPYQVLPTRDAEIVLAVGNDRQFKTLCIEVLERPDIARDPRFATNRARLDHRAALIPLLTDVLRTRDAAEWQRRLARTGIPAGTVRTVGAALQSPEATARDMVRTVEHSTIGPLQLVASPIRMSGTPVVEPSAPPLLGEHTEEVLAELLGPARS